MLRIFLKKANIKKNLGKNGNSVLFILAAGSFLSFSALYNSLSIETALVESKSISTLGETYDVESYIRSATHCANTLSQHTSNPRTQKYLYSDTDTIILDRDPSNSNYMVLGKWKIEVVSYDSSTNRFKVKGKHKSEKNWKNLFRKSPFEC